MALILTIKKSEHEKKNNNTVVGLFNTYTKKKEEEDMQVCNAVTFNCCLTYMNGAFKRAAHVADAFYSSIPHDQVDVICLQELVTDFGGVVSRFLHHPHATKELSSAWYTDNFRFLASGLCILSRWPILEQDAHVFRGGAYHAEKLMAKGILYAKIQVSKGNILHVFNTHLQAWTNEIATDAREQQMKEIHAFMQQKLLHMDARREFVIWGADTNADVYEHTRELSRIFDNANLKIIMPTHPMFSFDPAANPLGATDDPSEYALRRQINTTTNSPVSTTQTFPKQLIDFFAILKSQTCQVISTSMSVIPIQTVSPFLVTMQLNKQVSLRMVSDHFAVRVKFVFEFVANDNSDSQDMCRDVFTHSQKTTRSSHNTVHVGWVFLQALIFIICFVLLFLLFQHIFL